MAQIQINLDHLSLYRFPEVPRLLKVCWLEIRGKIKTSMLSPTSTYAAYFVFKITDDNYYLDCPVDVSVGITGGKPDRHHSLPPRRSILSSSTFVGMEQASMPSTGYECPKQRGDGWFEVEIGEFYIHGDEDGDVELALTELRTGWWKRGLIVQGYEIRPKVVPHGNGER